jgi:hypothetical protein
MPRANYSGSGRGGGSRGGSSNRTAHLNPGKKRQLPAKEAKLPAKKNLPAKDRTKIGNHI